MRVPRVKFTVRRMIAGVAVLSLIMGGLAEWARRSLRETEIQRALLRSPFHPPPGWWPQEWRREYDASWTVDGEVKLAGKPVGTGTVSFILRPGNRVFHATIGKGRYSLMHTRLPSGYYRVEVESLDGPKPQSVKSEWEMPFDHGNYQGLNLAF